MKLSSSIGSIIGFKSYKDLKAGDDVLVLRNVYTNKLEWYGIGVGTNDNNDFGFFIKRFDDGNICGFVELTDMLTKDFKDDLFVDIIKFGSTELLACFNDIYVTE